MKKNLIIGLIALVLSSCKSNPTTAISVKDTSSIKGEYTITSVTYPGQDLFKVKSFEIGDSQCLVGSTWNFIANNNSGSISLNKIDCIVFDSSITWYINKEQKMVLKLLNNETKAKNVKEGYVLSIMNLTKDSFQLSDRLNIDGNYVNIIYEFKKKN